MLKFLRRMIPERHPLRLLYHKVLAAIAALYYGFPSNKLIVVGVTGTNGKTTTVNIVTNILNTAGYKVGMSSSINFQVLDKRWPNISKQTTRGPFYMQKLLREMVSAGCKYAILEVTSHAIDQSRIFGINFDIALITNVTPEHIEYHGSFNDYLATKGVLFKKVSKGKRKFGVSKALVLNTDDKYYNYFDHFVADRKITYGMKMATVYAENVEKDPEGSHFVLHVPNNSIPIRLNLPGDFNVANTLAAVSVCMLLQVPIDLIKKGVESTSTVEGRFEHVNCGQLYSVVVDYAHTPEALESLFALYRKLTPGRLFAVFGSTGGGRDKSKRPIMGQIVNEHADFIVVTDDDPYDEDEYQIIDQVSAGIPRKEGHGFWKIPDRREAIRLVLTLAKKGDSVLICGKGAEQVMKVRGKTVPWNDKEVVTELLEREIEVELQDEHWEKRPNVCLQS